MNLKADKEEMLAMEMRLGSRTNTLEAAILKGLKVISDKVGHIVDETGQLWVVHHCWYTNY